MVQDYWPNFILSKLTQMKQYYNYRYTDTFAKYTASDH